MPKSFQFAALVLLSTLFAELRVASAHGSVTPDADLCIIQIGYLKAHFKIYQPEARGQKDYCEDLPSNGRTIFIMEYEHSDLGMTPVDFRVIKNVTGKGQFANAEDIERIANLDFVTVFHHPAAVQEDVFMVEHDFSDNGTYIGVVTVTNPDTGKDYIAVFPFEVGYWGVGYWPLIVLAALALQLHYLWMNGWFRRFRKTPDLHVVKAVATVVVLAVATPIDGRADQWTSRAGHFEVGFVSDLQPLVINKIHSWTLTVTDGEGRVVQGASIEMSGGMPVHDHGLPTTPQMTSELGEGRYRIEGIRFHMRGEWIISVTINSSDHSDVVRIPLTL